jgi:hypothetical protein
MAHTRIYVLLLIMARKTASGGGSSERYRSLKERGPDASISRSEDVIVVCRGASTKPTPTSYRPRYICLALLLLYVVILVYMYAHPSICDEDGFWLLAAWR